MHREYSRDEKGGGRRLGKEAEVSTASISIEKRLEENEVGVGKSQD